MERKSQSNVRCFVRPEPVIANHMKSRFVRQLEPEPEDYNLALRLCFAVPLRFLEWPQRFTTRPRISV